MRDVEELRGYRRYSDKRWRARAKKIGKRLGEFDYIDIKNALLKRAKVDYCTGRRPTVGGGIPTDRELVQELKRAAWCEVVRPNDGNNHVTRYRYVEREEK